jgi:hypothetical protein
MATGSRSLTLKLLADIDDFTKNLNKGETQVQTFGDKMSDFGKKIGVAFGVAAAAAAAYATKLAIDGVKSAIEDEAAQVRLANSLKATTGATNEQIAAVEEQILKTSLATGVADDQLRPALQRLAISTGNTADAQKLLNLSLDVAQSTGKPLEAVVNGISKAYDGSNTALGKLGIGLSAAELKTMSFQDVQTKLSDLFGGAAAANAETFQGRMARLQVAFDEAKEAVGAKLLPIIEKLVKFVIDNVLPALTKFAKFFDPIKDAITDNQDTFIKFADFIETYIVPVLVVVLGGALKTVATIAGGVIEIIAKVIDVIMTVVNTAIDGINFLIRAYNSIPFLSDVGQIQKMGSGATNAAQSSISTSLSGLGSFGASGGASGGAAASSSGNASSGSNLVSVPSYFSSPESLGLSDRANTQRNATMVNNITVNGAIDSESTARQIVTILNDSSARGTLGSAAFA